MTFSFLAADNSTLSSDVTATISGTAISATVPFETDVTALVATFSTTGSSVAVDGTDQTSGSTANDFSSAVIYTVTSEDNTTQDYTVTVSTASVSAKKITAFSFLAADNSTLSSDVTATISGTDISATVPFETDVTALVATFSTTGSSVAVDGTDQTSGSTANDFSSTVTYTVTAADNTTRDYTVTVSTASVSAKEITAFSFLAADNSALSSDVNATVSGTDISATVPFGTDVTDLVAIFSTTGSSVAVDGTDQTSGSTANDFSSAVTYTVTAADGSIQDYTVTVSTASVSDKEITAFSFLAADNSALSSDVTATVSGTDISATVPSGTNVTALVATFTTTGSSVAVGGTDQTSGSTANNFSSAVTYTVTAADNSTQNYTVTVITASSSAKEITAFSFLAADNSALSSDVTATVSGTNISATVPSGTDVTALVATFTTTGSSIAVGGTNQTSGSTANDFSSAVTYIVTAGDSSTQNYTVTVTVTASLSQQAFIKAANSEDWDQFGQALSLSGDTLAVGVEREASNQTTITNGTAASSNNSNPQSGAVYVYSRSGTDWSQQAYIKAVNNDNNDRFGHAVSLSGDTLAVGAWCESSNQTTITNGTTASSNDGNLQSGAVYVYSRSGTDWSQQAYIKAANNETNDYFGRAVSLSGDTLAVGAHEEDSNQTTITNGTTADSNNSNTSAGAIYVYSRSGTDWSQQAYIKAANNDAYDEFGKVVSLSGDTLAVGVDQEDSNQTTITNGTTASSDDGNSNSGAVYVYTRSGTNWSQQAYIKAANSSTNDYYGNAVSLSGDTLAVGAYLEDSNQTIVTNGTAASSNDSSADSGAVYVYTRSGTSWSQQAYIKASNNNAGDRFGNAVSLSGDTLVVGAPNEDSSQTTITGGTTASSDNNSPSSGAVYVYARNGTVWSQQSYIKAANSEATDKFGTTVFLSNGTLAVGADFEDSDQATITNGTTASSDNNSSSSGAVYVYQ